MPATLAKSRWQDTAIAHIYIAEGQQALSEMQFSEASLQRLAPLVAVSGVLVFRGGIMSPKALSSLAS
eukprot:4147610-Pyramimonas_sp.AAC.1